MVCSVLSVLTPTDDGVIDLSVSCAAWTPVQAFSADQPDKPAELPIDRGLMQRLSNFTLKDVTSGRSHTLYGYQGRKAIVLVFLGNECPVGNLYVPRLIELNREFRKKGVVFLGINSNAHETGSRRRQVSSPMRASIFRS